MSLFELGEKKKILFYFLSVFFIGLTTIIFVNNFTINKINKNYIDQNIAIIGAISEVNNESLDKVIPIVTKGNMDYYEYGKEILSKYSYDTYLKSDLNPLIKNEIKSSNIYLILVYIIIFIFILVYVIKKMSNIWNYTEKLTKKAEYIVEGRFIDIQSNNFKDEKFELLNLQFDLMRSRIEKSINDLKQEKINLKNIINDISHQLKTPLAAISMYNDILKEQKDMESQEVDYFINLTNEQIRRMDWLIKTLLKYARLESNVVEYKKENLSLNETVREAIEVLEIEAREKKINLRFRYDSEIVFLHDRKWIQEAIINIIKNGIEHTDENGSIDIILEESELFIRIEIKDNGEGIPKSDINKIFNRFHKGSNSVNPKSIGIGLSLSKNIIESNGGSIKVNSILGEGSSFIITFLK